LIDSAPADGRIIELTGPLTTLPALLAPKGTGNVSASSSRNIAQLSDALKAWSELSKDGRRLFQDSVDLFCSGKRPARLVAALTQRLANFLLAKRNLSYVYSVR
jgi:hypothetical protein